MFLLLSELVNLKTFKANIVIMFKANIVIVMFKVNINSVLT